MHLGQDALEEDRHGVAVGVVVVPDLREEGAKSSLEVSVEHVGDGLHGQEGCPQVADFWCEVGSQRGGDERLGFVVASGLQRPSRRGQQTWTARSRNCSPLGHPESAAGDELWWSLLGHCFGEGDGVLTFVEGLGRSASPTATTSPT
jgi:hypothetical protein